VWGLFGQGGKKLLAAHRPEKVKVLVGINEKKGIFGRHVCLA
jgi:hypothetical protein